LFEAFHPLSKVNFYALQYTLMNWILPPHVSSIKDGQRK
jgi:hypothetical protein